MEYSIFLGGLGNAIPHMVVWIIALVFSIVLSRRTGGKLERFLIVGSSLMLVSAILSILSPALIFSHWSPRSSLSNVSAAAVVSGINLFLGLISLAGAICLFYAIWKKFNERAKVIIEN